MGIFIAVRALRYGLDEAMFSLHEVRDYHNPEYAWDLADKKSDAKLARKPTKLPNQSLHSRKPISKPVNNQRPYKGATRIKGVK